MVDYNELEKYFKGKCSPVIMNCGGILLELGEDYETVFYKLCDGYYADVNNNGRVVQAIREGSPVLSHFILEENSLEPVKDVSDLNRNTYFIKRLTFTPSNYVVRNRVTNK